jgi:3-hydroxybutyryl-CoA dehydrogenase
MALMNDSSPPICIIGAGRMGEGMAVAFSYAGFSVTLIDLKQRLAGDAEIYCHEVRSSLEAELLSLQSLGLLTSNQLKRVNQRIQICSRETAKPHFARAELIFEAVPEVLDIKQSCFAWLSEQCSPDAIIASTTSTFLVTQLAEFVSNPGRFVNAHWLNPAMFMPLVEISRSATTSEHVVQRLSSMLRKIGKVPVVCAPVAGYIVPRLQALVMNEAARMVEEGLATAEEIDTAVNVGFGLRFSVLGLLEFIDWGGGDTLFYGSKYLVEKLSPRFRSPSIIAEHMHSHRNGMRDGQGFYNYDGVNLSQYKKQRLEQYIQRLELMGKMPVFEASSES